MLINSPLTVGDIFDKIFKLIGKTYSKSLLIGAIILLPAGIILYFGVNEFFSMFKDFPTDGQEIDPDEIFEYFGFFKSIGLYSLSILLFSLATLVVTMGVIIIGCREVDENPISYYESLSETFSNKSLRLLRFYLLIFLVVAAVMVIAFIFMAISFAVDFILLKVFGVLSIITGYCVVIYLAILWSFGPVAIGYENLNVIDSFKRSAQLVRGNWWRVFGIIFLFSVLAQFALSLVTTPLSFIVFWDFFVEMFSLIGSNPADFEPTEMFKDLFASMGGRFTIIMVISSIANLVVTPLIYVVLYFDLKIRKKNSMKIITPKISLMILILTRYPNSKI